MHDYIARQKGNAQYFYYHNTVNSFYHFDISGFLLSKRVIFTHCQSYLCMIHLAQKLVSTLSIKVRHGNTFHVAVENKLK